MAASNAEVDVMRGELARMQPLLEESQRRTEEMMAELTVRKQKASEVRVVVSAQEAEASEQQMLAAALQEEARKDLDQVGA